KKDGLSKITPSVDNVSKKLSKVSIDSEAKTNKRPGKEVASVVSYKDSAQPNVDKTKKESGTASDSEEKPLNQISKKVYSSSTNADGSSSRKPKDKKKRAWGKVILPEKDGTKISTRNEDEEMIGSPKAVKSNKLDSHMDETHMKNSKRKHTPSKEKGSDTLEYGENLIGLKENVWWPKDHAFYDGVIQSFDPIKKKHKVLYDDGDVEILNLKREKWEVIKDESGF
ncbi:protein EMSY-LIKE 4-like, partial [Hibiscus syriacus]|uniref:protein EMSY-LIKE 4-like n=1 Tax=Hibiscus syriacus TaxID=106335 RepID=UPI0019215E85